MTTEETPEKKSDKPYSYRPGKNKEIEQFLEQLLTSYAGNRNKTIEHCVLIAMDKPIPAPSLQSGDLLKLQKKLDEVNRQYAVDKQFHVESLQKERSENSKKVAEVEKLKEEIKTLKQSSSNQPPVASNDAIIEKAINALKEKKKLATDQDVIRYALQYVLKNDWL